MLQETQAIKQIEGEPPRRWFFDETLDLLVWCDPALEPIGFQLIYPTPDGQRVLTRWPTGQVTHNSIDEGASHGGYGLGMTRLLAPDGAFDLDRVLPDFQARAEQVDDRIKVLVVETMREFVRRAEDVVD